MPASFESGETLLNSHVVSSICGLDLRQRCRGRGLTGLGRLVDLGAWRSRSSAPNSCSVRYLHGDQSLVRSTIGSAYRSSPSSSESVSWPRRVRHEGSERRKAHAGYRIGNPRTDTGRRGRVRTRQAACPSAATERGVIVEPAPNEQRSDGARTRTWEDARRGGQNRRRVGAHDQSPTPRPGVRCSR